MTSLLRIVFNPDTTAPTVPAGLTATAISSSRVDLAWTSSTDPAGPNGSLVSGLALYRIFRNSTFLTTSTLPAYSDTGLAGFTNYTYTVSALDAAGLESAQSTSASARTLDQTAPSTPTGLTATAASSTQINISWTASTDSGGSGLAGYKIERSNDGTTGWSQIAQQTATTYPDTGLTSSTQRFYRLRSYDVATNNSGYSSIANATTQGTGPQTINVSTVAQLNAAVASANSYAGITTIVIADGTYTLTSFLNFTAPNVTVRSASGNRANVTIQGDAISASAAVLFNIRVAAANFVAENLTFGGRCRHSAIQIVGEAGANNGRLTNVVVRDSFEHLLKSSTDGTTGASGWTIELSLFTFTALIAPAQYNGGIDAHKASGWNIRRNRFEYIASPASGACQHAVSLWNGGSNNVIERNAVFDCDKGIGSGINATTTLGPALPQNGDKIRNNQVTHTVRAAHAFADVPLILELSQNAEVFHNTVYSANSYPNAIEYRFTTTGSQIRNNLTNKAITARDGGTATVSNNVTTAQASYFVNVNTGDLDLLAATAGVVDAGAPTLPSVTIDYEGDSRPLGTGVDIGADEFSSSGPLDLPLVNANTPIFGALGNFTVPSTIVNDSGVGGGGFGMSADGASLYIGAFFEAIAKITVPASMGGAASLQVGWTSTPGQIGPNQNFGSNFEYNGQVYRSKFSNYDEGVQSQWIQRGSTSLTGWTALSSTSGQNMRMLSQAFMHIPALWQSLLGGPVAALGCRLSIITNAQCGYGFAVFNPANVGSNVPVTPLLNYPYGNALNPVDSDHPGWAAYPKNSTGGVDLVSSQNNYVAGAFIVPGSRSLLFITSHGYGNTNQGCRAGSVHHDPNRVQVVAYDLRDIVAVKNGTMQPHQPQPYAWWLWNGGGVHWTSCVGDVPMLPGWGVFDPVRSRWYMSANMPAGRIYAYSVTGI